MKSVNTSLSTEAYQLPPAYEPLSLWWIIMPLVTVAGNTVVLVAMLRPRARRRLAHVSSFTVVQLAFADLAVGLFAEPLVILHSYGYLTTQLTCLPFLAINLSLVKVTMLGYTLIAVERYTAVPRPYQHPRWFSTKHLIRIWICFWIYGVLHGFLPSIVSLTVNWSDDIGCNFDGLVFPEFLVYYTFLMTYVPEMVVIAFAYISLVHAARRQRRKIAETRIPQIAVNDQVIDSETVSSCSNLPVFEEVWMAGRCLMLILLHIVCHFPISIVNCVELWGHPDLGLDVEYYLVWLAFANSALDPLFYAYANKCVRKEIKRLFVGTNTVYSAEPRLSIDVVNTRRKSTDTLDTVIDEDGHHDVTADVTVTDLTRSDVNMLMRNAGYSISGNDSTTVTGNGQTARNCFIISEHV